MTNPPETRETILVVGAAGFIGAHVTRALLAGNFSVRTLSARDCGAPAAVHFNGRTTDPEIARAALVGCDRVIYLGGSSTPGYASEDTSDEVQRELTPLVRFAELAGFAGCRQFIFTSSGGTVYGLNDSDLLTENEYLRPISIYGVNKVAGEHYLRLVGRKRDMAVLTLRLSNPYGPGQLVRRNQGLIAAAMAAAFGGTKLPIWGDGSTIRDYVYIDDVSKAYVAACRKPPASGTLNIASGRGTSILKICQMVEEAVGLPLHMNYEPGRDVDIPRNVLSFGRAYQDLNWAPGTTLEDGIKITRDWWVQTGT